uniref:Uncharacterized protein n=1 Tax=Vespula pensylvanica TaxID=30213 RepID=A0A834JN50_VESPE|nr:hypothetical protein H0235_017698 [Vespula pensylvanica]
MASPSTPLPFADKGASEGRQAGIQIGKQAGRQASKQASGPEMVGNTTENIFLLLEARSHFGFAVFRLLALASDPASLCQLPNEGGLDWEESFSQTRA